MDVKDKASDITHTAISRVRQARLENAQEHNDHLRAKNDLLEDELKRTRSERERLADALGRARSDAATPRSGRVRRAVALGVAVAGAYVMGAKAGRQRYEQIRRWAERIRNRPEVEYWQDEASQAAARTSEAVERVGNGVADSVQDKAAAAASRLKQASASASEKVDEAGATLNP
jgi:hypothetical protein